MQVNALFHYENLLLGDQTLISFYGDYFKDRHFSTLI